MLTQKEKDKIIKKIEAKQFKISLDKKKNISNSIWTFLNSNFGLWIISAVFISGISSYITKLNIELQEEQRSRKNSYRLLDEFGARFSELYYLTNDGKSSIENRISKNPKIYTDLLFNSSHSFNSKLHNEFDKTSLMTIAFELEQIIKIDSVKNRFRDFRHDINRLRRSYTLQEADTIYTTEILYEETTKFRIKWRKLLFNFGYFGDLDTYLGYKPDFDIEETNKLFGYTK